METLGFFDSPSTGGSWTTANTAAAVSSTTAVATPSDDPFTDWTPNDVGQKLVTNNIRWGLLIGMLLIAVGLAGAGYWIYQQPGQASQAAQDELTANAAILKPTLESVMATGLSTAEGGITKELRLINADARSLFNLSGALPESLSDERSIAAAIASQALEGSRLVNDANAYRSAVIPILAAPEFETDPALIALDDAAVSFGSWQARFKAVTAALPAGTMTALGEELTLTTEGLNGLQSEYLDALRSNDRGETAKVIEELVTRLERAEIVLETEFETMSERARLQFSGALEAIELLLD